MQTVILPPQTPVPLLAVPEPASPPIVQEATPKLPAVTTAQTVEKPKKAKKRPVKTNAATNPQAGAVAAAKPSDGQAPSAIEQPAAQGPSQQEAIGQLSVGGEQSPRAQQEAADLIAANERRLQGVSADVAKTQSDLLSKARNFQKEARQALQSNDAEGAKTLATKSRLLLDDLETAGKTQ